MPRKPVHIPHSEIGKLAFPAESVGIFAKGEYPAVFYSKDTPCGCPFFFSLAVMALDLNSVPQRYAQGMPVHICRAERVKLACKRQACISAEGIPGLSPPMRLDKKDANRKNRDFLGFSSFFGTLRAKCGFS